ncbi:MAG: response regulator transcription factor [Acidobacteriota bacterium]
MTGTSTVRAPEKTSRPGESRLRVLLADDHQAMLERVKAVLEPEFDVVGAVDNGRALVRAAEELDPDVLVVDISMPLLNGIDAVRQIMKSGSRARVIFLTVHEDPDIVPLCLDAGAQGFVVKSRLASDLVPAIQFALINHKFVSATMPWESRS